MLHRKPRFRLETTTFYDNRIRVKNYIDLTGTLQGTYTDGLTPCLIHEAPVEQNLAMTCAQTVQFSQNQQNLPRMKLHAAIHD
jgi:hypothetical protein